MNPFDTNIGVRILVDDDPKQSARARAAVAAGGFVSKTVVLEAFWVLESVYGLKRELILGALMDFAALPGMTPHARPLCRRQRCHHLTRRLFCWAAENPWWEPFFNHHPPPH